MTTITDGWFQLDINQKGYLESLNVPWMRGVGEESVCLQETFGFFFLGKETFVSPEVLEKENAPALNDIITQSGAVKRILEEKKQNGNDQVLRLPAPRNHVSPNASRLEYNLGSLIIERTVKPHPVHPIPVVEHKVTNLDNVPISVNYYWCLGTYKSRYGVISEKGDMVCQVMRALGHQSSIYFIRMSHSLRTRHNQLTWAYLNLNFGTLAPGKISLFRTKLWCLRHLWVGTQFSGMAYALSDQDPSSAIATMAVTPGRRADAVCSILERHYSPIFVLHETTLPIKVKEILTKAPIRKLLTNIRLAQESQNFCSENNIDVVYLPDIHKDPYVAVQKAIDTLLEFDEKTRTFVNILPASLDRQLLLSYYYSLRCEPMTIGPFTAPVRNTFVLASTLGLDQYEWEPSQTYARILGTKAEVSEEVEQLVSRQVQVKRYEYSQEENAFNSLLTFFAYHDYTLPRLAIETMLDNQNPVRIEFAQSVEQATGTRCFWDVPLEIILEYGKTEIYGPPFSVIVPTASSDHFAIFNAAIGAQYAKAILACLHPMREISSQAQGKVKKHLESIAQTAYQPSGTPISWPAIQESFKVISDELQSRFNILSQVILQMGNYGARARAGFGRMGVYLFLTAYSLPIELISSPDNFGRIRSVSTITPYGRMSFPDPLDTGCYGTENVLDYQDVASTAEVLIASDPTGDLPGSIMETGICTDLCRSGWKPKLLLGANKKLLSPDNKLIGLDLAIGEGLPCTIEYAVETKDGRVITKQKFELASPKECNVENFIQSVSSCIGLHYTGHGTLDDGRPALVLSDGNLRLDEFPHLNGRPWIFLNACEVGQVGEKGLGQSAMTLIERGARYVIAPLLAIKDIVAMDYASLYTGMHLLLPIAMNFHASRHGTYLEHGDKLTDHLAYVVYGDPFSPQGGSLWEIFEAMIYAFMGDQEAQKVTKEALHFYEREVRLYEIINGELQSCFHCPDQELKEKIQRFFAGKMDASIGFYFALTADTFPTGEDRLKRLNQAAEAFRRAALRTAEQPFNMSLMSGYGLYRKAQHLLEAVSLEYLRGRIDLKKLKEEYRQAIALLKSAIVGFERIGAEPDASTCRRLIEQLQTGIDIKASIWNKTELTNLVQSLLHKPKDLV